MIVYAFVQKSIIGVIVAGSALYMLRRLLPNWVRNRQSSLAEILNQPTHPRVLRSLGDFIKPGVAGGGGCGSGCSSCSSCASNPEADATIKPMEFQRRI